MDYGTAQYFGKLDKFQPNFLLDLYQKRQKLLFRAVL